MEKQILFCLSILIGTVGLAQKRNTDSVLLPDGKKISIINCMQTNAKLFGGPENARGFCNCLVPKLYSQVKNNPTSLKLLKEGKLEQLQLQEKSTFDWAYSTCLSSIQSMDTTTRIKMTPEMKSATRSKMMQRMKGTSVEVTHNLPALCDCMINGLEQNFTLGELASKDIANLPRYKTLYGNCLNQTVKSGITKGDCSILRNGRFRSQDANDSTTVLIIEKSNMIEYQKGGKLMVQSSITWKNDCEYETTMLKTNIPNFPYKPGTVMKVKIDIVQGNFIYYTATVNGESFKGKFKKLE